MRQGVLVTAGERLAVDCAVSWVGDLIEEAADGGLTTGGAEEATVQIRVEATRDPFETSGWRPLARGVLGHDRSLVLRNLLSIGFDLRVDVEDGTPRFTIRWRPAGRERAMALVLRSRFHLLARSALLRYRAVWWAGTRGRAATWVSRCLPGEGGSASRRWCPRSWRPAAVRPATTCVSRTAPAPGVSSSRCGWRAAAGGACRTAAARRRCPAGWP